MKIALVHAVRHIGRLIGAVGTLLAASAMIAPVRAQSNPSPSSYFVDLVRLWGRESRLGDLARAETGGPALELRFWFGFSHGGTRAIILRRTAAGLWEAERARIHRCSITVPHGEAISPERRASLRRLARTTCPPDDKLSGQLVVVDTVAVEPITSPRALETVWAELVAAGLESLPVGIERPWISKDGLHQVLEWRQDGRYRASHLEVPMRAEDQTPEDAVMRRVALVLRTADPEPWNWR